MQGFKLISQYKKQRSNAFFRIDTWIQNRIKFNVVELRLTKRKDGLIEPLRLL